MWKHLSVWMLTLFLSFSCVCHSFAARHYVLISSQAEANEKLKSIQPDSYIEFRTPVSYIGGNLNIPEGCVLKFAGGMIKANQITGNGTVIDAPLTQIINTKAIKGAWLVDRAYPEWFGGKSKLSEEETQSDVSDAIDLALCLSPSELCFSKGVYHISRPIVSVHSNIHISGGAEICALNEMRYDIKLNDKVYQANGMIIGDFATNEEKEIFGLSTNKMIYGGGCINANYKASTGIVLNRCLRTVIKDITIKNVNKYGFQASVDGKAAGNCFMLNCVFKNEDNWHDNKSTTHHQNAIAIYNNKSDCDYTNIEIVNFQTAVLHEAYNGIFTNVHAWLRDDYYWPNSVTFDCLYPDITLTNCEADTMRRLVKCHTNNFHAAIVNCRSYNNTAVVNDKTATKYPPIIIDKDGVKNTQINVTGGYYWFNTPYQLCSSKSEQDNIQGYIANKAKIIPLK